MEGGRREVRGREWGELWGVVRNKLHVFHHFVLPHGKKKERVKLETIIAFLILLGLKKTIFLIVLG
jgi:hypothetical protein